ncbi:MAG TPA: 7TM diverse intracellular signaling domain-containing protein [Oligoflexus sp.]|uniref:7TMR-DISM family protein n=1 Tax=Oligoflexus sp. TaxID=1971216 RepID=UPI002D809827|nr:7TM diverse intracellular signaling domain-containing protein [Oligoflexus sp.]HET9238040.1 7TM diverse intracellular signaling domain-containing protein [Oligoflexus sp.]
MLQRILIFVFLLTFWTAGYAAPWIHEPGQRETFAHEGFLYLCSAEPLDWQTVLGRTEGWIPTGRQKLNVGEDQECWSLITIHNRSTQEERVFLQHGVAMTSRVDLYQSVAGRLTHAESLGMDRPLRASKVDYRLPIFDLRLSPGENTLLIRQKSRDVFVLDWRLYNPDYFYSRMVLELMLFGGFFAICFALSFYNLVIYFVNREISQVFYFFYLNFYAIAQLYLTGFLKQLGFPDAGPIHHLGILSINAALLFTMAFIYYFLDFQHYKRWFGRVIIGYMLALGVPVALTAFDQLIWAANITQILSIMGSVMAVLAAVIALKRRHPLAMYFLIAWSLLIVGNVAQVLHLMAAVPDEPWIVSLNFIGASFEAIIISYALAHKMRLARLHEAQRRRHAFSQLEKMVYPHQMEQMKEGGILETTMPHASGEAVVICLDIIASTSSQIDDLPNFLRRFFDRCGHLMNRDYQGDPLSASGFRIKEMGDGFLCAVGFPFQTPPGHVSHEVALQLAFGFLNAFDEEFPGTTSESRSYCSIGMARGAIQGFFTVSGIRSYELFGDSIVLATRYESLRKQWPASRAGHMITMPTRMYEGLPPRLKPYFQKQSLGPGSAAIRNDAEADAFYRGIFEAGEAERILKDGSEFLALEQVS